MGLKFIAMDNPNGAVKTKQQMADEYGVCLKTFNRLLMKKNVILDRGLISPRDQMTIYSVLGLPGIDPKFSPDPEACETVLP
jgi:hypothetical protein